MKNVETMDFTLREDERGRVAWPIRENLIVNRDAVNIHIPCLRPGSVRGNHYHICSFEYVLLGAFS